MRYEIKLFQLINLFSKRNPAQEANNVVKMAFNMLDIIKVVRKEVQFETLNMRIGIHTVKNIF